MTEPGCDRDRLWAFAAGALTDEEAGLLEQHLAGCAGCRERLTEIRADVDALGYRAGEDAAGDDLAKTILEQTRAIQRRARRLRWLAIGVVLIPAILLPVGIAHRLTAKATNRRVLWQVEHAIQRIQNTRGSYPADEAALARELKALNDSSLKLDAEGRPLDLWDHPLRYRYPGVEVPGGFDLWSLGPDGVDDQGGPGDQTNWR